MLKLLFLVAIVSALTLSVPAQKTSQSWTNWSRKEVEKMLNNSAWGQTQTETEESEPANTSAVTAVAASGNAARDLSRTGESGEVKGAKSVKYRIRLLSARPVREAFARLLLLSQEKENEELSRNLQAFVDRDFGDYIVVAVSPEPDDKKLASALLQAFTNATAEKLKNSTYLERKDGKRLFLLDYRAPATDGMGAKFVFARTLEGQRFINAENDSVRFVADVSANIKLRMKYKLGDMSYQGKLEY